MNRIFPLCVVFITLLFSHASGSFFEQTILKTEGKIVGRIIEDMNDDGLLDILAVYTTGLYPETVRWLAVFLQEQSAGFQSDPSQVWAVDPRAAVLDIGDISDTPGLEILFFADDGVYFYGQEDGRFETESRPLIETRTVFALAEEGDLPTCDFCREICLEPGEEVLVFTFGELELWCRDGSGTYQLKQAFPVNTTARVFTEISGENHSYSMRADYRTPRISAEDFNNDGHTDIIVSWDDNLDVFLQAPGGSFAAEAAHQFRMGLCDGEERENDEVDLLLSVNDLNGDGQMDIVANKMKGGLSNARTQTSFYLRRSDGSVGETPDRIMTADDAISEPLLVDLNGDDLPDLIQPRVKMGIKSIVSMLLMKKFDINFLVYLNRGGDLFSTEPDFSTKIGFKIDFSRQGGSASPLTECDGDYNGDGRKDLAVGTKEDELSIFFGDSRKVFT